MFSRLSQLFESEFLDYNSLQLIYAASDSKQTKLVDLSLNLKQKSIQKFGKPIDPDIIGPEDQSPYILQELVKSTYRLTAIALLLIQGLIPKVNLGEIKKLKKQPLEIAIEQYYLSKQNSNDSQYTKKFTGIIRLLIFFYYQRSLGIDEKLQQEPVVQQAMKDYEKITEFTIQILVSKNSPQLHLQKAEAIINYFADSTVAWCGYVVATADLLAAGKQISQLDAKQRDQMQNFVTQAINYLKKEYLKILYPNELTQLQSLSVILQQPHIASDTEDDSSHDDQSPDTSFDTERDPLLKQSILRQRHGGKRSLEPNPTTTPSPKIHEGPKG